MAVVKGVKERVHLPLYDSLSVRPERQLREFESSSVFKFFVNVQGKTKLETNMQASSLLPHWNTFEARALRVVVSDLAPRFPKEVGSCLDEARRARGRCRGILERSADELSDLAGGPGTSLDAARRATAEVGKALKQWKVGNAERALDQLADALDFPALEGILGLQGSLAGVRDDVVRILERTKVKVDRPREVERFRERLRSSEGGDRAESLLAGLRRAAAGLGTSRRHLRRLGGVEKTDLSRLDRALGEASREWGRVVDRLEALRKDLLAALADLETAASCDGPAAAAALRRCLAERLRDRDALPASEQLAGAPAGIFAALVYNSVTTFIVGEKVMIQMPTWFFPSGAGPFSEDGRQVTHGLPSPEATFRFAEPILIDTQQNFRVEIEIPERGVLAELQRLYGPFFIWVVLDGYMVRDVQ